jgi:uncharacterized protein YrrD
MLRKAKALKAFKLGVKDAEIGKIKDFYFDDESWTVRYLVADTGTWLPGRKVLISPHAVKDLRENQIVDVDLTRQQIEQSPSIEADRPVSRQFEIQYHQYYNWPVYWGGPWAWGPVPYPDGLSPGAIPVPPAASEVTKRGDPHLRSATRVTSYSIQALNDHFGHVDDFIIDDQNWAIRYLDVDTRNWWPGKHVLVPSQWISWVSWPESRVYIDLDRETVKRAPPYESSSQITREYEAQLFAHYGRAPYWETPMENAA